MVVSMKQMHAGDGYGYLVRNTADINGKIKAASQMTAYYTTEGNPPGTWLGSGLAGLDGGIGAGEVVTRDEMERLFKYGQGPRTGRQLGKPMPKPRSLEKRIEARLAKLPTALTGDARTATIEQIKAEERARRVAKPVAGFDFTFSPVKSVSVLWALADQGVKEQVYEAHKAAIADVLATMEERAAYTRVGTDAVAQVETKGLIAATFDHWDARGGDPQLHTHVVVSNRVQGTDGKWRTLDSRGALFPSVVAMSELYNARIADHLTQRIGVDWEERAAGRGSKARWFEIKGIDAGLTKAFSTRSAKIEKAKDDLIDAYREKHGREPSTKVIHRLRQQATLATRPDKTIVSLATLQERWRERAEAFGIRPERVARKVTSEVKPKQLVRFDDLAGSKHLSELIDSTRDELTTSRSTWTTWNARAAATRATMHLRCATNEDRLTLIDHVVEQVADRSIPIQSPTVNHVPAALLRSDGSSAFERAGGQMFTSAELILAEQRLTTWGRRSDGPAVDIELAERWAKTPVGEQGRILTDDQAAAMVQVAASGRVLDVLVGPAGTGKTTMLAGLREAWEDSNGEGKVKGLAPSAAAAAILGEELGIVTDNTAKWFNAQTITVPRLRERLDQLNKQQSATAQERATRDQQIADIHEQIAKWTLTAGDLLIVDEASLAGTRALDQLAQQAADSGAKLLLVGDWAQLAAVDAGGAFGMLVNDREGTAPELSSVHRFKADWEKAASISLRVGDAEVIDLYDAQGRIHEAEADAANDQVYEAWSADIKAGKSSLMIAADNETVAALNTRARDDRIAAGLVETGGIRLHDQTRASRGDEIVTRKNDRQLATSPGSWVKNGDKWKVTDAHKDGSLQVQRHTGGPVITLPAEYVEKNVELAYATTAHRAQGATVDTAHAIITESLTREVLYVAATRGREANELYVVVPDQTDTHEAHTNEPISGRDVLASVLSHTGAALAATEAIAQAKADGDNLSQLVAEYETIGQMANTARWDQLTKAAVPGLDGTLTNSPAWSGYVRLLRHVEAHGYDPQQVVAKLAASGPLGDEPIGELVNRVTVLARRMDEQPTRVTGRRVSHIINGVTTTDPDMARALADREQHIGRVVQAAKEQLLASPEPWLARIGHRPATAEGAAKWDAAVESTLTYRLLYDVKDTNSPFGPKTRMNWSQHAHLSRADELVRDARRASTRTEAQTATRGSGINL